METCDNCKFFGGAYKCRRYPPTINNGFPHTEASYWCGEWTAITPPAPETKPEAEYPVCDDCGMPIVDCQGFCRINGRDNADGFRHAYAEDCRAGLLARLAELEAENARLTGENDTLRHILRQDGKC